MEEIKKGDTVEFIFRDGKSVGEVTKVNDKTLQVKILWAGKNIVVKRHVVKHEVELAK